MDTKFSISVKAALLSLWILSALMISAMLSACQQATKTPNHITIDHTTPTEISPPVRNTISPTSLPTQTSTPSPLPPSPTQAPATSTATAENEVVFKDNGQVYLGDRLLLDPVQEAPGCFGVEKIDYSPTQEYFLIVLGCFEGDNQAFLYQSNGDGKREVTAKWDYILYSHYSWAPDGLEIVYQRTNSCCVEPPAGSPPKGLVIYDVLSGDTTLLFGTTGAPNWGYPASPSWSPDGEWIAFSFMEYKKSTTFYLINPEDFALQKVDVFDSDQVYGSFEWELSATSNEMLLYFLGDDDEIMRIYTIDEQGEVISTAIP